MRGTGGDVEDVPVAAPSDEPRPPTDPVTERLLSAVAGAVRKICPRWLAVDADDLTQNAVAKVLGRIRATAATVTYTPGYLYRAAYSEVVDEIRRCRGVRHVPIDPELQVESSHAGNPEQHAEARETLQAIAQCLATLSPSRRRAVMLHLQGHSISETGALLDCGYKKVDNLIRRGMADLRAALASRGVEL